MNRRYSKLLDSTKTMPAMDWRDAQRWLIDQPDVRTWIFDLLRGRKTIVFDPATRSWKGRDA